MSILNHFGKVKTTFIPYKSKHNYGDNTLKFCGTHSHTHPFSLTLIRPHGNQQIPLQSGQQLYDSYFGPNKFGEWQFVKNFFENQGRQMYEAKYTGIQDFTKVIEDMVTDITSSIWKTVNINPVLTLTQLLCLKVDDVDSRVDHLEKMLAQVIDDNKLLQRKVDALEQQKRIKDAKFMRVLIEELD
jgi:hypothetical protein